MSLQATTTISYPQFQWCYSLSSAAPYILYQIAIPFGDMSFHSQWVIAIHFIQVHVACEVLCQCTCVAHALQSCVHEARVAQIVEASSPFL
jgi:hypothetical protein